MYAKQIEFRKRMTKIMQILDFNENKENHWNLKIPLKNYENHEHPTIPLENHENLENIRIRSENYENHVRIEISL